MNEEEFDALMPWRPFGTKDAIEADAQWRRSATLAGALFGKTLDDLKRQLLAPYPDIPSGFALADFRELERHTRLVQEVFSKPRRAWLHPGLGPASPTIVVRGERFTLWEARCEVVRRAIEHLEKR